MKIFLLCFGDVDSSPLARILDARDQVEVENEDGARAYSRIARLVPDMIICDGDLKPSHVRETLKAIRGSKRLARIPIFIATARNEAGFQAIAGDTVTIGAPDRLTHWISSRAGTGGPDDPR